MDCGAETLGVTQTIKPENYPGMREFLWHPIDASTEQCMLEMGYQMLNGEAPDVDEGISPHINST